MSVEVFKNDPCSSVLDGGINGSQTTLDVDDGSAFPAVGNFRLRIDDELLLCTGRSSNTLTVTRGVEGTSGAVHADDAAISHILTAGSLDARRADDILVGAYSARPAAGRGGALYLPTDAPALHRDDGAAWQHFGPLYRLVPPPANSGFSWVNQGGASVSEAAGSITLTDPHHNNQNVRARVKAAPSTPYTIRAGFLPVIDPAASTNASDSGCKFGVCVHDGTKFHAMEANMHSSTRAYLFHGHKYTNATTNSAYNSLNTYYPAQGPIIWLAIENDGSNIKGYFSFDGINWLEHFSESISFLTPTHVGFLMNNAINSGTPKFDNHVRLVSWEQA